MSHNSNENSAIYKGVNNLHHNNTHYISKNTHHYTTMDLSSQAQIPEHADNILSRMDKLRAYANEQQTKRVTPQRQQTSFGF